MAKLLRRNKADKNKKGKLHKRKQSVDCFQPYRNIMAISKIEKEQQGQNTVDTVQLWLCGVCSNPLFGVTLNPTLLLLCGVMPRS